MNLTSWFNFKFLKENFKKSRAIILLCIFLLPILTVITNLIKISDSSDFVPGIYHLSYLFIIGLYIIPIVLSITLFSFVFKRKSCDFVMSFPITKKQIFMTNTVGGIGVLLILNILNCLMLFLVSLISSNIFIPGRMIFDIFLLWTVAYIFVFVVSNIAISVSANKITSVVVVLLILFLIPFLHTFITVNGSQFNDRADCILYETRCINNDVNNDYYDINYNVVRDSNYTVPYLLISKVFLNDSKLNYNVSIVKTFVLSLIYIFVGLSLFDRKKFEIVETSFKNEKIHLFVKSLTVIPFLALGYLVFKESGFSFEYMTYYILLLAIIITYLIIYDLITRKRVLNVFKSLLYTLFALVFVILLGMTSSLNNKKYLDVGNIKEITLSDNNKLMKSGSTRDSELIKYIFDNCKNYDEYEENIISVSIRNGSFTYYFDLMFDDSEYTYIVDKLNKDDYYKKSIDNSKPYVILDNLNNRVLRDSKLVNDIIMDYDLGYYDNGGNLLYGVDLYFYDNYSINNLEVVVLDEELRHDLINYYNNETMEYLKSNNIYIYRVVVRDFDSEEDYYLSGNNIQKLINVVMDKDLELDFDKSYVCIRLYTSDRVYKLIINDFDLLEEMKSYESEW